MKGAAMDKNALIVHGGAPTAVINASLYGAVRAFKESGFRGRIFGARGGSGALLTGDFIDLTALPQENNERSEERRVGKACKSRCPPHH